jgi:ionotropic glutamate receptor
LQDVDGVVADLTITKDRWEKVDFTQPYVQSSLLMVVPLSGSRSSNEFWIFLMPFSTKLWAAIVVLFFVTMIFLFFIEVKCNCNRRGETTDEKTSFQDILWSAHLPLNQQIML